MRKASKPSRKKPELITKSVSSPNTDLDPINFWHEPFVHVMLIVAAGFIVYFNTITTPFLFDDITYLVTNPAIKDFSFFTDSERLFSLGILPDVKNNVVLRPVSYFTYAVNYAVHGLDVRGYHLTNLIIHIANGLLVYLTIMLVLQTPAMVTDDDKKSFVQHSFRAGLPLCCALLFVCHPLQTQAVTYIIQRFTSFVVLFYLGTLVLYAKSRLSPSTAPQRIFYGSALLAAILAMNTKENAFTLPLSIALFEFMFFSGPIVRRLLRLAPFLLTMAIIPIRLSQLSFLAKQAEADVVRDSINFVNFSGVSSWHYLMTQFGVIATYLRLLVFPIGQNFDYDIPLQTIFWAPGVLLPLFLLLFILGTGIWLCYRSWGGKRPHDPLYKLAAFGIFWFFLTLSVESSIVPIDDLLFEHRAYLPSFGFFLAVMASAAIIHSRVTSTPFFNNRAVNCMLAVMIIGLSVTGIVRNEVWKNGVSFWRDVAEKSPDKPRGHLGLGAALIQQVELESKAMGVSLTMGDGQKRIEEAIGEFRTALTLRPDYLLAHVYLGKALTELNRFDEASAELLAAAALNPKSPLPHIFLGDLHEKRGDIAKAREAYFAAIAAERLHPEAHLRLGRLYAKEGNTTDAIAELEMAYRYHPDEDTAKELNKLRIRQAPTGPVNEAHPYVKKKGGATAR